MQLPLNLKYLWVVNDYSKYPHFLAGNLVAHNFIHSNEAFKPLSDTDAERVKRCGQVSEGGKIYTRVSLHML